MKCHVCSNEISTRKTKAQMFTYNEKSIMLEQPGLWCDSCEEDVLTGNDIAETEKTFNEFKLRVAD
jgi:YgiT-type zinc finger domain-containing protein